MYRSLAPAMALALLITAGCAKPGEKNPLAGKWTLVTVSKEKLEKIEPSGIMTGSMTFGADGTCEAELAWPDKPQVAPMKFKGTYKVEGEEIHITNAENGNVMPSSFSFSGEYLALKARGENTYTYYYKRERS
ncbi:MAG: hypothetical protein DIJKHBIC_03006 [Thermoanaerobaculia bacterium]|nr:hypothetical protein [Thermoanaerobaculia bacterium]